MLYRLAAARPARSFPIFRALRNRVYRAYALAGMISVTGSWMQLIAQNWLVLRLTGSVAMLGANVAVQAVPGLLLGLSGGVLADRLSRRRILLVTQSLQTLLALILAGLVATGLVTLWAVWILSAASGLVGAVDGPSGGALAAGLVDADDLPNAIALGSVFNSVGRVLGMALAGVLVARVGMATVFALNAVSFLPVIVVLARLARHPAASATADGRGVARVALRDTVRDVLAGRGLTAVLAIAFLSASFGRNYQVTMAAMTRGPLHAGAAGYGICSTVFAAGALVGGLVAARLNVSGRARLVPVVVASAVLELLASAAPGIAPFAGAVFAVAITAVLIDTVTSSTVQLAVDDRSRGRMLALLGLACGTGSVIGAPLLGWLGDVLTPRGALGLGGLVVLVGTLSARSLTRPRRAGREERAVFEPVPACAPARAA